jgi:ribonuclease-3 family protein
MENNDTAEFFLLSPISPAEALKMHPMALAFVGDSVHSLYMRTRVSVGSHEKSGVLHREVTAAVKAVAQSALAEKLAADFDEDEHDVFRRARNCKIQTSAKHAAMDEYRRASGFEAVIGFLYLTGNNLKLFKYLRLSYEETQK